MKLWLGGAGSSGSAAFSITPICDVATLPIARAMTVVSPGPLARGTNSSL